MAELLKQFVAARDVWYDVLKYPLGLIVHMLVFVVGGWLMRLKAGRSYEPETAAFDASRGLSITMYFALLAGLADTKGIGKLLDDGIGVGTICYALLLGFIQELVGYFRNLRPE